MVYCRLTVVKSAGSNKHGQSLWKVRCDCGTEFIAVGCSLITGNTKSCGCYSKDVHTTHGCATRKGTINEYAIWASMKNRCLSPTANCYHHYGGRGIKVCKRWLKFENFLKDMGKRPSAKHSVERIDNNGDYDPSNCMWATRSVQNVNKRTTRRITFNGVTLAASEWAKKLQMKKPTLMGRLNSYGWPIEKALTTPVRAHVR